MGIKNSQKDKIQTEAENGIDHQENNIDLFDRELCKK